MSKDIITAERCYNTGVRNFVRGARLYGTDLEGTPQQKDMFTMAFVNFWKAFTLGYTQAVFPSAACCALSTENGVRDEKRAYAEKLAYGVALRIGDPRCEEIRDKIIMPREMQPAIDNLTALFMKAQLDIPLGETSRAKLDEQDRLFNEASAPPEESLLSEFINRGASRSQDLERQHAYQEILRDTFYSHDEQVAVSGNVDDSSCVLS